MTKPFLTIELSPEKDAVDIHGDDEGLRRLIERLESVLTSRQHEHLMTPSWGGSELSEELQQPDDHLVHKLSIHLWPKRH